MRQERLAQLVEEWRTKKRRYGYTDCCQFVGLAVKALTGEDRRNLFPRYRTRKQAQAILDTNGGMVGLLTRAFGPMKAPAQARRGDVIAADFGAGIAAGLCVGTHACAPGPNGLAFVPRGDIIAAWSV